MGTEGEVDTGSMDNMDAKDKVGMGSMGNMGTRGLAHGHHGQHEQQGQQGRLKGCLKKGVVYAPILRRRSPEIFSSEDAGE
mmetsp:Transcript_67846/g.147738  ORF Transcript_67846/g.147738 Transcript_67846/m.147738 type:complete len:81 (+) Transcript_67846:1-243(+)